MKHFIVIIIFLFTLGCTLLNKKASQRSVASSANLAKKIQLDKLKISKILSDHVQYQSLQKDKEKFTKESDLVKGYLQYLSSKKDTSDINESKAQCNAKKEEMKYSYQELIQSYRQYLKEFKSKFTGHQFKHYFYDEDILVKDSFSKATNDKEVDQATKYNAEEFMSLKEKATLLDKMKNLMLAVHTTQGNALLDDYISNDKKYQKLLSKALKAMNKYFPEMSHEDFEKFGEFGNNKCEDRAIDQVYNDKRFVEGNFFKEQAKYNNSKHVIFALAEFSGEKKLASKVFRNVFGSSKRRNSNGTYEEDYAHFYNDFFNFINHSELGQQMNAAYSDTNLILAIAERYKKTFKQINKRYKTCVKNFEKVNLKFSQVEAIFIGLYEAYDESSDQHKTINDTYQLNRELLSAAHYNHQGWSYCSDSIDKRTKSSAFAYKHSMRSKNQADRLSMLALKNYNEASHFEKIAQEIVDLNTKLTSGISGLELTRTAYESLLLQHLLLTGSTSSDFLNKLNRGLNGIIANDVFSLKVNFEQQIANQLWQQKEASYQVDASNVFDIVNRNLMQCYSGTLHFIHALLNSNISESIILDNIVIISTKGHVNPGIVLTENGQQVLYGVETTALGPSKIKYGPTKNVSGEIRVTKLTDYLVVEALKADILNTKSVLDSTYENIQALGFVTSKLKPYAEGDYKQRLYQVVNNSPFVHGLGGTSVTDEIKERSYLNEYNISAEYSDIIFNNKNNDDFRNKDKRKNKGISSYDLINHLHEVLLSKPEWQLEKTSCYLVDTKINLEKKLIELQDFTRMKPNQLTLVCAPICRHAYDQPTARTDIYNEVYDLFKDGLLNNNEISESDSKFIRELKLEIKDCNRYKNLSDLVS